MIRNGRATGNSGGRAGGRPARLRDARATDARNAVVSREGVCTRLEDGRIFCRGSFHGDSWRELHGPFQAHAANVINVCGVTAPPAPRLRCWRNREGWPEIPEAELL